MTAIYYYFDSNLLCERIGPTEFMVQNGLWPFTWDSKTGTASWVAPTGPDQAQFRLLWSGPWPAGARDYDEAIFEIQRRLELNPIHYWYITKVEAISLRVDSFWGRLVRSCRAFKQAWRQTSKTSKSGFDPAIDDDDIPF